MSWPSLADIGRLPLPGTDVPSSVRFAPDGRALTYLQAEPGSLVQSLWRHDLATGERTLLVAPPGEREREAGLSHAEHLERERRRTSILGVTEYAWLGAGPRPVLLVPMGGRALLSVDGADFRALPGVDRADTIAGSPDGAWVAFVRGGDIWIAPVPGGVPFRLTDDAADGVTNGLAEYVAAEELDRFDGMWWSRDGGHLAFAHVDAREIPTLAISHLGDERPFHEEHRYPFAGGPNATVALRVATVGERRAHEARLPMQAGDYLARVVPHPLGGWLVALLPRAQHELAWYRMAPDATVEHLWTEEASPWINLDHDTRVLPDGRILRSTERSGYRHLELRDATGGLLGPLTTGDWAVSSVAHVDADRSEVFFHGRADGPTEQHLYRVPLEPAEPVARPERMTTEPGWHEAVFSDDGAQWVETRSDLESSPMISVHALRDGGREPRQVCAPSRTAITLGIRPPELLELLAADGSTTLHAALYRPGRPAAEPPPCVVWVYGGPHEQYVKRSWEATVHPLRQYLAAAGVAVLVVDGRGSTARGLPFEAPIRGRMGSAEVEDQAAAVRHLVDRGEIDVARIGIVGGSYGGFMVIRCMALEPELFRVGVATAPVTAWDGYDTAYTERYLGMPGDDAGAYATSSLLGMASAITGKLLLIHGAIDENVHLRHSIRLLAELQGAGRDVELVVLPADRHRVRSASGLATRDRRTVRHLLQGLRVPLPADVP